MTLGYLLGAAISDPDPRHGAELYEAFPVVRRTYDEVQAWTGIPAERILTGDFAADNDHERFAFAGIRLATLAFGIHDLLADREVHPGAVGGISLGGLISSCLAGALGRRDLFELLVQEGRTPARDTTPQGAAIAFIPADEDHTQYYADPDVHLGGDFGLLVDGSRRLLMLSGTRAALDRVAAQAAPGVVSVIENQSLAVHSPLRQYASDFMAPHVAALPLSDPKLPLCSFLEQKTLTTADEVRDLFVRNKTHTMSLVHVVNELRAQGTRLAFVLGPSLPEGAIRFPFPVVHIKTPEQLTQAMTAMYEYGVGMPSTV
ncbi:ACP S-malonyltransferase [Actinocrispum wychmicini]|uniref:[acyl-carrier-protein] S-malonyltransferase n=1 Tax=Actinocrispum wychmicini TaxID=1213861 RepID=A0A4R2JL58_9PSEU|nr:ACP S-malonyltransferase [Actinocrispum wychmicini]TCO59914.1 [acyl-carrier-protein] S-malonyltransferase [Actinocrispum wychmicini]